MNHSRLPAVGIMGGTFDPVHNGHLRVALEACEELDLDEVRLVPLNQPNHRAQPVATAAARLDMLTAAAQPPLIVDDSELRRGGVSYTVDTLAAFRAEMPRHALYLLLGQDAYETLPAWHQPERLLELAHIVVAARSGPRRPLAGLDELIGNAQSDQVSTLKQRPAGHVYFLDSPQLPIASSDLRARLAAGRSVRHLVPDAVAQLLAANRWYDPA